MNNFNAQDRALMSMYEMSELQYKQFLAKTSDNHIAVVVESLKKPHLKTVALTIVKKYA